MTLLAGILLNAPTFGDGNARLAPAAQTTRWEYPPPISVWGNWVTPSAPIANRAWAKPHPRALPGFKLPSYFDDFYNRIHIKPSALALGNVVTTQQRTVEVWNAWINASQTLTSVLASDADGIILDAPGGYPMAFAPLQSEVWIINVTTTGSPVINAVLSWLFAGNDPVDVTITGNRLTAWTIAPDWGTDLVETLEWLTDFQQGYDGDQYREVVRDYPRRTWEFALLAEGQDRQIAEAMLYDWSGRIWAIPVWTDLTLLATPLSVGTSSIALDTTGMDYVADGLAILWTDSRTYEMVEIDIVTAGAITLSHATVNAWPAGARIYPCRKATLTDYPAISRGNDRLIATQVRMQAAEPCDWAPIAPATSYLGFPVFDARGDETRDPKASYDRQLDTLDNDTGTPSFDDPSGYAWMTQGYAWLLQGRSDRAAHRSLLYWLQGRAQPMWLPSWTDDLTLMQPLTSASTTLTVAWCGVTRFLAQQPGRRHLRIALLDGTVLYRKVTGSSEVDSNTEQVAIDSQVGRPITPDQVLLISWMALVTLSDDKVSISHQHDVAGVATCGVTFAGVPAEEP